jgi:hypothetical protein
MNLLDNQEFHRRLRRLIGRHCRYLGRRCRLVEVLTDADAIVLGCEEGLPPIQGDQFGQPLRRAVETLQVPLHEEDGDSLSDELLDILRQLEVKG